MNESQIKSDVNRNITINALLKSRRGNFTISESTCVANVDYDLENEILTIEFQYRGTYAYKGVPLDLYVDFEQSSSRGRYFNFYVRDQFSYERVS